MRVDDKKLQSMIDAALNDRGLRDGPRAGGHVKCADGVYLLAYESRNPSLVFVPDPCKRGRYCRVPRNFLYRGCGACGALPGQPCHNPRHGSSWSGSSGHASRGGHAQSVVSQSFYDDVVVEQGLVNFAKLATAEGVTITVSHMRWCKSLARTRKKLPCDCDFAEREKRMAQAIRQLPDLRSVDYVPERKRHV